MCRRLGHATGISVVLGNLGLAALLEHRPRDACAIYRQALLHDRELGYTEGLIYDLAGTAAALASSERTIEAAMILGASRVAAELTGVKLELLESEMQAQATETLRRTHGDEPFAAALSSGGQLDIDTATEYALRASEFQTTPRPEPVLGDTVAGGQLAARGRRRRPSR